MVRFSQNTCHIRHADIDVSFIVKGSVVVDYVWRVAVVKHFKLTKYLRKYCWFYF